jgi:hypothetical protein
MSDNRTPLENLFDEWLRRKHPGLVAGIYYGLTNLKREDLVRIAIRKWLPKEPTE